MQQLQRQGIQVWMVSGDNQRTANYIAARLGITHVLAGVKPQDKAERVKALQTQGHSVAIVGDGINDAPALAIAYVGIAVGSGTDVAIETADVVLMKSRLNDVCTTLHMSGVVMRRIRLNFFWAICYNVIGIPLAAGVFFPYYLIKVRPLPSPARPPRTRGTACAAYLRVQLARRLHTAETPPP